MLRYDFTIIPLCPFNQKGRRGTEQFYRMHIRGQEIIYCFLFASRWQQIWLPVSFMDQYCSRTNELEGCRSPTFCYSLPNKPLSFFVISYDCKFLQVRNFINLSAAVVFRFVSVVNKLNASVICFCRTFIKY